MWYSWRARLFNAMVLLAVALFALSLSLFLLISVLSPIRARPVDCRNVLYSCHRSALVEHSAARMFDLVNDVQAYPSRFRWCSAAQILEQGEDRLVARLDLGLGSFSTWFQTENTLRRPYSIDMQLRDGPFKQLHGRWEFHALAEDACKVTLTLEFEPARACLVLRWRWASRPWPTAWSTTSSASPTRPER